MPVEGVTIVIDNVSCFPDTIDVFRVTAPRNAPQLVKCFGSIPVKLLFGGKHYRVKDPERKYKL